MGNSETFHILQTYQAYLKSTPKHVEFEIYRKGILGKPLCVKLVRGAYLVEERRVAAEEGYQCPIQETKQNTDDSYNYCAGLLTDDIGDNDRVSFSLVKIS